MFSEIHAIVSGRVQMVMYRDFAQRKARKLDLIGTVENLKNGTVEVVAQGTPESLKRYIEYLNEGSVLARVDDVAVVWRDPIDSFDDFCIRF